MVTETDARGLTPRESRVASVSTVRTHAARGRRFGTRRAEPRSERTVTALDTARSTAGSPDGTVVRGSSDELVGLDGLPDVCSVAGEAVDAAFPPGLCHE